MGSWNATCQISQMPICAGDKVRFLLLVKSPFCMDKAKDIFDPNDKKDYGFQPNAEAARERCYSDSFWNTEFVPVRAKYNDYGSVYDIDTESLNWSIWMEIIKNRMIEISQGPNPYHDLEVKKDMNTEQLLDVLRAGRLHFEFGWKGYKVPVSQVMIREDVYQAMLKLKFENVWWVKEKTFTAKKMHNECLEYFSEEKLLKMKNFLIKENKTDLELKTLFRLYTLDSTEDPNRIFSFMTGSESGKGLKQYENWIKENIVHDKVKHDDKKFKSLLKDLSDFMFINLLYSSLRKTWAPGTGAGSQDASFDLCADYYNSMAKLATANIPNDFEE